MIEGKFESRAIYSISQGCFSSLHSTQHDRQSFIVSDPPDMISETRDTWTREQAIALWRGDLQSFKKRVFRRGFRIIRILKSHGIIAVECVAILSSLKKNRQSHRSAPDKQG